ncbi:FAD-binding protein, partial [Prochlorococcus sp. AH-716-I05]|nr:FAD-binding protein [Prochlorococcus sp. AH-716-I05]
FLRDPGNLIGLEAVTMNEKPSLLKFDAEESEPLNHAYGTNGIITSLLLATDIKRKWYSIVIDCVEFEKTIEILKTLTSAAVDLKLGAILEGEIVDQMPKWFKNNSRSHKILLQSTLGGTKTIELICKKFKVESTLLGEEEKLVNGISEVVWNHTTLQMRSKDKNWTYLQMLLPLNNELELINFLRKKWGKKVLWHLEAVSQQGSPRLAALPVLKWNGIDELNEIMEDCKKLGAFIFNPHVLTVEGGGLGVVDADQVKAKLKFDPKGLLNPGKLEGWEVKEQFNI